MLPSIIFVLAAVAQLGAGLPLSTNAIEAREAAPGIHPPGNLFEQRSLQDLIDAGNAAIKTGNQFINNGYRANTGNQRAANELNRNINSGNPNLNNLNNARVDGRNGALDGQAQRANANDAIAAGKAASAIGMDLGRKYGLHG